MAILLCIAADMDLNNDETKYGPPNMHLQMAKVFDYHNSTLRKQNKDLAVTARIKN